jgi:hypothetical protein
MMEQIIWKLMQISANPNPQDRKPFMVFESVKLIARIQFSQEVHCLSSSNQPKCSRSTVGFPLDWSKLRADGAAITAFGLCNSCACG